MNSTTTGRNLILTSLLDATKEKINHVPMTIINPPHLTGEHMRALLD